MTPAAPRPPAKAAASRRKPAPVAKAALSGPSKAADEPVVPVPPVPAKPDKPSKAKETKEANAQESDRVRGTFRLPVADHARIAKLKATAKRNGLKVKKNELFRLGLRHLQTLSGQELHDAILSLRLPAPVRRRPK